METKLINGDYVANGLGGVVRCKGDEALLARVLYRLTARRGSFPFLPGLGSRMGRLRREKPSAWDSLARQFAVEALADMAGLTVTGASVRREDEALWVTVELLWQGTGLSVTAQLEG